MKLNYYLGIVAFFFLSVTGINVEASEYCINRFNSQISSANAELSSMLNRQLELDKRIMQLQNERNEIAGQIATIISIDPNLEKESSRQKITDLSKLQTEKKIEQDKLESEGHSNNERISKLRSTVPANLQGELKGCLEAVGPVNAFVNFAVQGIALVCTNGAIPKISAFIKLSKWPIEPIANIDSL